jgi:hypothetical protein
MIVGSLTKPQWKEKVIGASERMELAPIDGDSETRVYAMDEAVIKEGYWGEYVMGRFLFDKKVNVPKVYAFIHHKYEQGHQWEGYEENYIVMQRLHGRHMAYPIDSFGSCKMEDFAGIESSELIAKLREEIKKIIKLGIVPKDADYFGNHLFVPEEKKVYLIDFGRYYRGSREQLEEFERRIIKENFIRTCSE